jgi:hypothetical protein
MLVIKRGYEFFEQNLDLIENVSWRFTPANFYYSLEYFQASRDFTIGVFSGNDLKVILVATINTRDELDYFAGGSRFYFSKNGNHDIFVKSVKRILDFLLECGVKNCIFEYDSVSSFVFHKFYSRTSTSMFLANTLSDNNFSIRKSYRSLINKQKRDNTNLIVNRLNLSREHFDNLRNLHFEASGNRRTRSSHSWELQFDAIAKNRAFMSLSYNRDGTMTSGALFLTGDREVFYGVSAQSRELMLLGEPTGHIVLKNALAYSQKCGFDRMILGTTDFSNEKEKSIVFFKKGFSDSMLLINNMEYELE